MSSNTPYNKSRSRLDNNGDLLSQSNMSMASGRSPANLNRSYSRAKSMNNTKRSIANNEFINKQLDPAKINEYISLLSEFEKNCIAEKKFKDAELAAARIQELKNQEIEYKSLIVQEKAEVQVQELEKLNVEQFREFNSMWDVLIQEHVENIREIESELLNAQEEELRRFDEETGKVAIPPAKFSSELLGNRLILKKLIAGKKYSEAQKVSDLIERREIEEAERWEAGFKDRFVKKKGLLLQRQKNELEALRIKLQNSLQEKLRMRQLELQKILQRFQNLKKGLEIKQNNEIVKIQLEQKKAKRSIASKGGNLSIDFSANRG